MYGSTFDVRLPVHDHRPSPITSSSEAPTFAFLEVALGHVDPRASAIAPNGACYVPVAHALGRLLLEQQAEVARAVELGATFELSDTTPVYLDDVAGFDHVALHLRLDGTEPIHFRIDAVFYRGDRVVATTEQRGTIAVREEGSTWHH